MKEKGGMRGRKIARKQGTIYARISLPGLPLGVVLESTGQDKAVATGVDTTREAKFIRN